MRNIEPAPRSTSPSATADQSALRSQLLERILTNPHLSTPPTIALKVVQETRKTDCSIQDVTHIILQDPALCGKLLKTINSPLYGLSNPVGSLNRAVTLLGLRAMRSLVLGLSLPALGGRIEVDQGLRNYWMGSVAGAVMSQELAKQGNSPCPEDDLVASLLRDMGMMLLRQTFGHSYSAVWNGSDVPFSKQCEWENRNLGIHHADVSAALLTQWSLPTDIVEPIRLHHSEYVPENLPDAIARRTRLLNFTSRLAQFGHLPDNSTFYEEVTRTAQTQFGMDRRQLEAFLASVHVKIEEFTALLDVDIGTCPNFAEILAAGCEELARLSMETTRPHVRNQFSHAEVLNVVPGGAQRQQNIDTDLMETTGGFDSYRIGQFSETFFERLEEKTLCTAFIEHYEVKEVIGRGAMGIVLKAHDHRLVRSVALKVLSSALSTCKMAHQRFALEARFAASIRSENVVAIFAVSELSGVPFLVMEWVEGISLQGHLDANRIFSLPEIIKIGYQTAQGLAAAHNMRLIHRDIKPANLLLENSTQSIRITDFGLVRAMDQDFDISQRGVLVGTPLYMSPEQVDGKPLTGASDLFSLGSVLYILCTGQLPFQAESMSRLLCAIAEKTPEPIQSFNPMIPLWLIQAIEKLHAKNPADRFPSASAFAEF